MESKVIQTKTKTKTKTDTNNNTKTKRDYFIDVSLYKKRNSKNPKKGHILKKETRGCVFMSQYVRSNIESNIYELLKENSNYTSLEERENILMKGL